MEFYHNCRHVVIVIRLFTLEGLEMKPTVICRTSTGLYSLMLKGIGDSQTSIFSSSRSIHSYGICSVVYLASPEEQIEDDTNTKHIKY